MDGKPTDGPRLTGEEEEGKGKEGETALAAVTFCTGAPTFACPRARRALISPHSE